MKCYLVCGTKDVYEQGFAYECFGVLPYDESNLVNVHTNYPTLDGLPSKGLEEGNSYWMIEWDE